MTSSGARSPLRKAGDAEKHPSLPGAGGSDPPLLRSGATTADAVLSADTDKPVQLSVTVPKSLRKAIRAEAKRRGVRVDEVVIDALRERTAR